MKMELASSKITPFPFHRRLDPPWRYRFQTVLADTPHSRRISFRLRYQVFCEETGFEDPTRFADKLEQDIYDAASTIFLVWDRLTATWAGTMRLVDARKSALPSETICWPDPLLDIDRNRSGAAEFSRLCIPPEFRRIQQATYFSAAKPGGPGQKSAIPVLRQEDDEILLRVILGFIAWAQDNGLAHCYFLISSALTRVLKRLHVPLVVAGPEVEHRGMRRPYKTHIATALQEMKDNLPRVSRILAHSEPYLTFSTFDRGTGGSSSAVLPGKQSLAVEALSASLIA
jgi:N-acyl amino acid synthase of PEP-CTERM/exosortase system